MAVVLAAACVCSAALPAHGQTPPVGWPDKTHLIGAVTSVIGPAGNPTSFTLELGTLTADIGTNPRTRFVARSLEAQVEKFVTGDYALVLVRKVKTGLIAVRITYDVDPFPPLRQLSGTVTWVSQDQMRFRMREGDGKIFPLRVRPQTRFSIDGRLSDSLPPLLRGQTIQVLALQRNGLDAYEIDVTRAGLLLSRGTS
jgi:hypothetical protein